MTIKQRLTFLTVMFLLGIIAVSGFLSWSMSQVRIGSSLYQNIVNDKDLLADILPPPEYIIESQLTFYQLMDAKTDTERNQLVKRMKRLQSDFQAREAYWKTQNLPAKAVEELSASQKAAHHFFEIFPEFVAVLDRPESAEYQQLKQALIDAYNQHRALIDQLVETSNQLFEVHDKAGHDTTEKLSTWAILLSVLIAIVLVGYTMIVARRILKTIDALKQTMMTVDAKGEFDVRAPVEGKDEIAEMSHAFNSLLQNLQLAINEANRVVGGIAEGRFDQRIQADLKGDLQVLKSGVNGSAESVDFMMAELGKVMDALYNGDFSSKMDERVAGEFRSKTEGALNAMSETVSGIISVMEKMQEGKFQHRVEVEARGDLLTLKEGVNNSMDALESAMQDITRVVVAQSDGDLTQSITSEYHGALRVLKDAVNASAKKLNRTVAEILGVSESVASASYEVSDGSNNLSRRTQEMAASLEETAASMEEMTSTVKQNTDFANQASQLATQARNQAGEGGKIAAQAVEAMRTITDTSYKISDIITLIDGIAFQTNLLALNAAVEAARAGDHGRGFAVVAGEVRSLAQKSAEASRDIKELIESSVANVEAGSKYVEETGASLESINGAIQKVSDIVAEIAMASGEQATGIDQVNKAIMSLDEVTQQNAALGEETSAAADSLNDQSASLKELMSFFTSDAQGQKQLMAQAKIEAAAKDTKAVKNRDGQGESWSEF